MRKPIGITITNKKHIKDKSCKKESTLVQTHQLMEFIDKAKSIIKSSFQPSSNRSLVIISLTELKNNLNKKYKKRTLEKEIEIITSNRLTKAITLLKEYEAMIGQYNDILQK